jgi:hypothetical protein
MATKAAVIVLYEEAVLIWAIPPLSPQPPDFFDHNPKHMPPPLFAIPFPDISLHSTRIGWNSISAWYFGSSQPLYFDMVFQDSKLNRFQITLKPDLSTASLHVISTTDFIPHDSDFSVLQDHYRICEDTLVSCWISENGRRIQYQCGVYMARGLTSTRLANLDLHSDPAANMLLADITDSDLFWCPASGRFVLLEGINCIAVLDFF